MSASAGILSYIHKQHRIAFAAYNKLNLKKLPQICLNLSSWSETSCGDKPRRTYALWTSSCSFPLPRQKPSAEQEGAPTAERANASQLPLIYIHRREILISICFSSSSLIQLDAQKAYCNNHQGWQCSACGSEHKSFILCLAFHCLHFSAASWTLFPLPPSLPCLRSYYIQSDSAFAAYIISPGRWQLPHPRHSRLEINIRCAYCLHSCSFSLFSVSYFVNQCMLHFCF